MSISVEVKEGKIEIVNKDGLVRACIMDSIKEMLCDLIRDGELTSFILTREEYDRLIICVRNREESLK